MERADILARIAGHPLGDDPAEMWTGFDALVRGISAPVARAASNYAHDLGVTVTPDAPCEAPPVVWIHGGSYVFGSPKPICAPRSIWPRRMA